MPKHALLFPFLLFFVLFLHAQPPAKFSYQAIIRDDKNVLLINKPVGMRISILQSSATGNTVYVETHTISTNINGLATLEIGGGIIQSGSMAAIDWSQGPFFIKTEADPAGGTNYNITGVSQLLSVPYAMHATSASVISGAVSFKHYIGEAFGGGVIFQLWKDEKGEEHGLVVATTDLSANNTWSNMSSVAVGNNAQSVWDGLTNSNAIVAQSGHLTSAAKLCIDWTAGGFSDWYLPSIQELTVLWNNYNVVARALNGISGAKPMLSGYYWSSSEVESNIAWGYYFSAGGAGTQLKPDKHAVRAIRAF
jgi:hypothetical protein